MGGYYPPEISFWNYEYNTSYPLYNITPHSKEYDMSSEKKQKLTKAELRRKETFEKMAEGLAAEGYTQKILKLNFVELNVLTLLIAIPFMIPFLAAFRLFGNEFNIERGTSFIAVIAFLLLIVVHELLHGIAF